MNQFSLSHLFPSQPQLRFNSGQSSNGSIKEVPPPNPNPNPNPIQANFFNPIVDTDSDQSSLDFQIQNCDSLAIFSSSRPSSESSNANQNQVGLPPISSLFSILQNHHSSVCNRDGNSRNRGRQTLEQSEEPLILLLSGRKKGDLKESLKKENDHWIRTHLLSREMEKVLKDTEIRQSLKISIPDQEIERDFKVDSLLDWLPTTTSTASTNAKSDENARFGMDLDQNSEVGEAPHSENRGRKMEMEMETQAEKDETEASNRMPIAQSNQSSIPIPDFSNFTSKEHERVLTFERKPTLIVLEGLSEMFSPSFQEPEESIPTVSEFSAVIQHAFSLIHHLSSSSSWQTQLILFDQNTRRLSLPIVPKRDLEENLRIPLERILEEFFDFKLEFSSTTTNTASRSGKGTMCLKNTKKFQDFNRLKQWRRQKREMGIEDEIEDDARQQEGFELKIGFRSREEL